MKSKLFLFIFLSFVFIFGINEVLALDGGFKTNNWQIEKNLIQIEVDENYPCHIENKNEIVCNALTNKEIGDWKVKENDIVCSGTNVLECENEKTRRIDLLNRKEVNYKKGLTERNIKIDTKYREKINIYELQDTIKIGFATNVFAVSGNPLENFDINVTTGMIRYRPVNITWLESIPEKSYLSSNSFSGVANGDEFTAIVWYKALSSNSNEALFTRKNPLQPIPSMWCSNSGSLSLFESTIWNIEIGGICSSGIGEWRMYSMSFNTTHYRLHNNYTKVGEETAINGPLFSSGYVIGAYTGSSNLRSLDGSLSDVRYYNFSMNSSDLEVIYNNNRKYNATLFNDYRDNGLYLYLPFRENPTGITYDKSGKGNNATTFNFGHGDNGENLTTLGYEVNISIVNMTNALVFWDNYTLINQSRTGNNTYSFLNNQTLYILDNFNLTEGVTRQNSPLWFSSTDNYLKKISSNLTSQIGTKVVFKVNKCEIDQIEYTSNTGAFNNIFSPSQFTCENNVVTLELPGIETATGSNELAISYLLDIQDSCDALNTSFSGFILLLGLVGTILLITTAILSLLGEVKISILLTSFPIIISIGVLIIVAIIAFVKICSIG